MEDNFEKMLKEFMFGEEATKRVNQHLDAAKKSWTESEERTREKVLQTMERNFEAELFRTVGLRIAGTLAAEGPLDADGIREKCDSVSRLSPEVLKKHLDYAVEAGQIGMREDGGRICYTPVP